MGAKFILDFYDVGAAFHGRPRRSPLKGSPGFRVKPGMTIKVKGFSTHYTRLS